MLRKKSLKGILAIFLLICFSVVALPVDFFHQHAEEETIVCRDSKGSCHHKVHLSKKTSFCWVCAIHFDKAFSNTTFHFQKLSTSVSDVICGILLVEIDPDQIFTFLRGPPSH